MRLEILGQIGPYLVLIGIKNIDGRIFFQTDGNFKECIRRKQIVVIHKTDEISRCCGKRCICILCNADIFRNRNVLYTRIFSGILFQDARHRLILRAGISDHQFPVFITLFFQGFDHLTQKNFRRTVSRNNNADLRTIRKFMIFLTRQVLLFCAVLLPPRSVRNLLRLHPLRKTDQEFLWPIMFQVTQSLLYVVRFQFPYKTEPFHI